MDKLVNIFVADNDEQSSVIISSYLQEISHDFVLHNCKSLDETESLINDEALNIFIVDASSDIENVAKQIDLIEQNHRNCKFIITFYELKTDYIIRLLRTSKKDFIQKPILKSNLLNIVNEIIKKMTSEQDFSGQGKIISVYSNKGGLGKTTVAVNLAYELGNINRYEQVALVDMNMFLGDVTTFLDLSPLHDMKDIAEKMDSDIKITDLAEQYSNSNLFIFSDSPYRDYYYDLSKEKIIKIFNKLRKNFKYIVVDLSSAITEKTQNLFDFSDLILLVSEANLPTLRNCKKCLDFFEKVKQSEKVELILNRYSADDECGFDDVEEVLKKSILTVIPNDWQNVTSSINQGVALGDYCPDAEIYDAYKELAELVSDKLCR